jgi:hypothetical protein
MLAFISNHRSAEGAFDLVHAEHDAASPPDPERVAGHEEAGVTWWLVYIQTSADPEAVRELASTPPDPRHPHRHRPGTSSGEPAHPGAPASEIRRMNCDRFDPG